MKSHFIAIAPQGAEFMYKLSSAILVPSKSAEAIRDYLNSIKYQIKAGEVWHIYTNDFYTDSRIEKEIKSFSPKRGTKVYRYRGGY